MGNGTGTDFLGTLGTGTNIGGSQEFWLSQSRPVGNKSLRFLRLGQKSLGQSRYSELWESSPWDKNPWDCLMPIPVLNQTRNNLML